MHHRRLQRGFTLIEMLIALAMITMIVSMVYGSYAATTRSMDLCTRRTASMERACLVLRLMAGQIRCAYAPPPDSNDTRPGTLQGDGNGMSRALGDRQVAAQTQPATLFRGDSRHARGEILVFVTAGASGAGLDTPGTLACVIYRYDRATSTLTMSRRDLAEPAPGQPAVEDARLLLHNVTGVELAFHDGRTWLDTWDSGREKRLPRAVRITVVVADEASRQHRLMTAAPVMCRSGTERGGAK